MLTNKSSKIPNIFECKKCTYCTSSKKDYNKHLSTAKHRKLTTLTTNVPQSTNAFICDVCNKTYRSRMGLWQHKQKCQEMSVNMNELNTEDAEMPGMVSSDLVMHLIQENHQVLLTLFQDHHHHHQDHNHQVI